MNNQISIVIPIFNEKKNIEKLSKEIKKKLRGIKYEVIFVDDKSTDGTISVLKKLNLKDKKFKYIIHRGKRDLTQSCFLGICKSKNKLIVIMDGDLQHNPFYIKLMLKKIILKKSDLVIGSRNFSKLNSNSLSSIRVFFSKSLIYILGLVSGKNFIDPMSGFLYLRENFILIIKKIFMVKDIKF